MSDWVDANSPSVPVYNLDAVNLQLEGDGTFFISYVADIKEAQKKFGISLPAHRIGSETALVRRNAGPFGMNAYYILKGDHRKEYEVLVKKGFPACFEYYLSKGGDNE